MKTANDNDLRKLYSYIVTLVTFKYFPLFKSLPTHRAWILKLAPLFSLLTHAVAWGKRMAGRNRHVRKCGVVVWRTLRESSHATSRKVSHLEMTGSLLQCSQISTLSDACQYMQHTILYQQKVSCNALGMVHPGPIILSINSELQRHDGLQPHTLVKVA